MHAYRHRGRPELKLTVRALHRSSSRIPTVWCTLGPGSGRSPPFCVPTHAYLPRAFLRPSQRRRAHPMFRRPRIGPRAKGRHAPHHGASSRDVRARSPYVGGSRVRQRVLRLAQPAAAGSALHLPRRPRTMPPQCARIGGRCLCVDTRMSNRGDQGGSTFAFPCHEASAACPCTPLAPRSLPHSFHVPTPPLDVLQEELRRKLQKTTLALEEANAALEELRGPYRLALAYREGLAVTVIAAAAVGATLWLCVLIARAHLLGYICLPPGVHGNMN